MTAAVPETALTGACHCGGVRVTLPSDRAGILACHCGDCQKLHGNFFAFFVADAASTRIEGGDLAWYRSSEANERAFCASCGSRVAKRPIGGTKIMVSVGLFDPTTADRVRKNLWTDQKPRWYEAPRTGALSPDELVALALAEPIESATAQYGYALRASSGTSARPGVVALTFIAARDAAERDRIRAHSRENVKDFLAEPGFVSIVTGFTGLRGFTVTAWTDEDAMKRALGKHHASAMNELFGQDFVGAVWTSVWSPTRLNRLWVRCSSCRSLEDMSGDKASCGACGASMPARPAYW